MSEPIHISQKIVVINPEGRVLTVRRTASAPAHLLNWDLTGGELEYGEDPEKGIERELLEETGIKVKNATPFDVEAHFNNENEFWLTIGWVAKTEKTEISLSFEHDEFKWVTKEEFVELETQPKLRRFVQKS